jgi:hypothetical protein
MENKNYISVLFDDEVPMLEAIGILRESNETIIDVLTPFPVHGLDKALSLKRSRIPIVGFIFGALGAILGFGFQAWVFTVSYPLAIGGKPLLAIPSFIPVTFECTILFAGLSMVAAMLIKSKLKPDKSFIPINENITDDMFVVLVESDGQKTKIQKIISTLSDIKTVEIK